MVRSRLLSHLRDAFECSVNELPLSFILSWYEQKAVCILLTLLHLGIKNIRLGPSLPAFLSPNILNFLVENYGIGPITTPEEDIKALMNHMLCKQSLRYFCDFRLKSTNVLYLIFFFRGLNIPFIVNFHFFEFYVI